MRTMARNSDCPLFLITYNYMKTKILAELKTKYKNLGLSDETYEGVANQLALSVKEETEIATAVSGAEGLLKSIQKFADSRVTSFKTESDTLRKKLEELEKGGNQANHLPKDDDTPAWAKSIIESNSKLEQKLSKLEGEKTHESFRSSLISTLSEKKIPESFYSSAIYDRQFTSQDDVNKIVDTITSSFEKYQQDIANQGGVLPEKGTPPSKGDSEDIAKMIDNGTKEIINQQK